MPNLGHTMEKGRLAEWLKPAGSPVTVGEVIATVESDKATFDVEAPADGVLLAIHVEAGMTVPVGTTIGVVGQPGEAPAPAPPTVPHSVPTTAEAAAPALRRTRPNASPAARTLAAELGVDLATVIGSGDDGQVTRDDVRAHAAAPGGAPAAPSPGVQPGTAPDPSPMRRAIAQATEQAWRTIPHVTLMRRAVLPGAERPGNVTALLVRAAAQALRRHRTFDGWWGDARFRPAPGTDIAVAMSANGGLLMPAVRAADTKTATAIGEEIAALAAAAGSGTLDGSQTVDASFTVTSLGRWGVEAFTPVINAPQVAILGVGAADRLAREAPDGSVRFRSELALCLVFDHRANDGVAAAEFLADIVAAFEENAR